MQCRNFKFVLLSLICFLTLSCSFLELKQDYGEISFNIPVEKTAADGSQISYTVFIKKPSGEVVKTVESTDSKIVIDGILKGNYSVVVEAYGPKSYFTGESNVTIVPGTKTEVPIVIKPAKITLKVLDYDNKNGERFEAKKTEIWGEFEKRHPQIKIEREVCFAIEYYQRINQYTQTGRMPDVFYMGALSDWARVVHKRRLAKDLTPYLRKDNIYDNYYANCINPKEQYGGYLAEIPFGITASNCVYVNKALLNSLGLQPAKTYEELKEQLPILKNDNKDLIIMANKESWVMQSCLFSMVVGRFGGKNWANDILSNKKTFGNSEPFKKAVNFIDQMYKDGILSAKTLETGYEVTSTKDKFIAVKEFAKGNGAYLIDGDWRTGVFLNESKNDASISTALQKTNFELMQFPVIPGEINHDSNSGVVGVGYGMSSALQTGSGKDKAAWELVKWLSGPEMQQLRLNNSESYPSLKKEFIDYSKLEPLAKKRALWYESIKSTTPIFDTVFDEVISGTLNTQLQLLGLRKVTPSELCDTMDLNAKEITATSTAEGVVINFPVQAASLQNVACVVDRIDSEGNYQEIFIDVNNLTPERKKSITDYFVDSGETYLYRASFLKRVFDNESEWHWETILGTKTCSIKSTNGGKGELNLTYPTTQVTAQYDQTNLKIKLNPTCPVSVQLSDIPGKYKDINARMWYERSDKQYGWINALLNENGEFDFNHIFSDSEYENYLNTPLNFVQLEVQVHTDGVQYTNKLIKENIFNKINGLGTTINLIDNRPELTATSSKEGVVINFPTQAASLQNVACFVDRIDSEGNYQEIFIDENNLTPETKSITDYFVDSGETYEYKARFMKKVPETGENWNWENVLIAKPFTITNNNGGKGELNLVYPTTPVTAEYDQANLKIKLNPPCPISVQLSDIPGTNKNMNARMWYERSDKQYGWINALLNEKGEFDFNHIFSDSGYENYLNTPLKFDQLKVHANIDGVQYTNQFNKDNTSKKITGLDSTITLIDNRPELTATSSTEGIVLTIPEGSIPTGATKFSIGRYNPAKPNDPTNGQMKYWYIYSEDPNKITITDYFVEPGNTYEYTLFYRDKENKVLKTSKTKSIEILNGTSCGYGEFKYKPETKVEVTDQNKGIIKLSPTPIYTSRYNDINNETKNLNIWLYYEEKETKEWVGTEMQTYETDVKFDFSVYMKDHPNCYEKALYPAQFCLKASIDGVLYQDILDATFSQEYNSPALVKFPIINVKAPSGGE